MALRITAWAIAIAASIGVFTLYSRPDFVLTLASQVWACF